MRGRVMVSVIACVFKSSLRPQWVESGPKALTSGMGGKRTFAQADNHGANHQAYIAWRSITQERQRRYPAKFFFGSRYLDSATGV